MSSMEKINKTMILTEANKAAWEDHLRRKVIELDIERKNIYNWGEPNRVEERAEIELTPLEIEFMRNQ